MSERKIEQGKKKSLRFANSKRHAVASDVSPADANRARATARWADDGQGTDAEPARRIVSSVAEPTIRGEMNLCLNGQRMQDRPRTWNYQAG
jgi:hypothetical protein